MPTYEYRCNGCGREFEIEQRMADDDLVKCEVCGQDKLEKLISWSAFQLKGSGWYKDLYASNPKKEIESSIDKGVPPKQSDKEKKAADTGAAAGSGDGASTPAATSTPAAAAPAAASGGSSTGSGTGTGGAASGGSSSSGGAASKE